MEKHNYKGDEALEKKKIEQPVLFIEMIINEYTDEQQNGFVMELLSRIAEFRRNRREQLEDALHAVNRAANELNELVGGMMGFIDLPPAPLNNGYKRN